MKHPCDPTGENPISATLWRAAQARHESEMEFCRSLGLDPCPYDDSNQRTLWQHEAINAICREIMSSMKRERTAKRRQIDRWRESRLRRLHHACRNRTSGLFKIARMLQLAHQIESSPQPQPQAR